MKMTSMALAIAAASLLTACGGDDSSSSSASPINVENVSRVLETNADIAYAAYSDSVTTAQALKTAITALAADPTAETLQTAKEAWLVAREPYGQTEVYRFRNSPIDSTDYSSEDGPEGDINAWPLGEALIDYVQTNDTDFGDDQVGVTANQAGINGNGALTAADASTDNTNNIIGDASITIDADLLANTATAEDEHDVISGYHAIEFLLWGQDLKTADQTTTDGTDRDEAINSTQAGGQRPLSDFVSTTAGDAAARRLQYLQVAVDKLIADLQQVQAGWEDNVEGNYRDQFTSIETEAEAKQKLVEILTGMGTLSEGELAGERMKIGFINNSQEDEHSCFSDNTHRDIWLNAEGVSNSYYGDYAGYDSDLDGVDDVSTNAVSGYGLDDYLADVGLTEIAAELVEDLTATQTAYTQIDSSARAGNPFDVLIMTPSSTGPVADTILALSAQANSIQEMATALELDNDVVDDEASACDTSTAVGTDAEDC